MAFLEVVPKGKFGSQVRTAAIDLLKKYKLSALPDPSSLGKALSGGAPEVAAKLTELDGMLKKIVAVPPQAPLNWDSPNWNAIASHFGIFPPENPSQNDLQQARNYLQSQHTLKLAKLVVKAETVHAQADSNAASANLSNFLRQLPNDIDKKVRESIESLVRKATQQVHSTSPSQQKDAVLNQYKALQEDVKEQEKLRAESLSDKGVIAKAREMSHPINAYIAPLKQSQEEIQKRPTPAYQAIWDQAQVIFETMDLEWNLRTAYAKDQLAHYKQELQLVENMKEELDDTQADHLLILKPQLVDEILSKFYDTRVGEEEQEIHLPSGFASLQEIEDAANGFIKEHKEFNDAEELTSHLIEEETLAMLAAGEHH